MRTVLVTGAIGSGKSEVCRYLSSKGYPVYDSDSRTKALYASVPGLKCRIEEALGVPFSEISIIFRDDSKREALESIVYPLVIEDFKTWRDAQDSEIVFFESALALDKPIFDGLYDEVLLVKADLEKRKDRNPKVAERDSLQKFDTEKADYVLENNSTLVGLHRKINVYLKSK